MCDLNQPLQPYHDTSVILRRRWLSPGAPGSPRPFNIYDTPLFPQFRHPRGVTIEQGGTPAARWEWEVTLTGGVAASKVFAAAFAGANFFYSYPKNVCPKIAEIQKIVRRRRGGRPWPEVSPPFGTHFFSENASYAKKNRRFARRLRRRPALQKVTNERGWCHQSESK